MAAVSTVKFNFTGSSKQLIGQLNKLIRKMNKVQSVAKSGNQIFVTGTKQGSTFAGMLNSVSKNGLRLTNTFLNMGNSLRTASQGMMSVGKAMTLFITPAIFGTLFKAAQSAINFDDALVRVKKTTNATTKELTEIARGLRNLAVTTATTVVDLAKIAEQVGQIGVKSPKAIVGLTKIFNMIVSATEITADKVGLSMGKIANALGIDLDTEEGVEQIGKLASVINRLENDMVTNAPTILEGLERFAQVGALLNFPPQIGAALIAALTSLGFSSKEAGTSLRNMTLKVVQNSDQVAILMRNWEKYADVQDLVTEINDNAANVLIDLVEAAAAGDNAAETLIATFGVAGIRGGKAWAALAGGVDTFRKALALADDEWENSLSLVREYEQSLLSTKSQLAVLKNNVTEVGLTLAETLLPVLNHLIQVAVPGIRKLAKVFSELSPRVQKLIVVVAILVGLAGPFIFFFSQMVFGFSMLIIAVGRAVQVLFSLVGIFASIITRIGPAIAMIFKFIASWQGLVAAIALGVGVIILRVTGLGQKIADVFFALADKAAAWGQNLIAQYGAGLLAGAVAVLAKVLTIIGNFIAKFLAGHSPPELGPLSHIGKWGQTVFDEYLKGFLQADFGILSGVGNIIEGILKNFEIVGNIGKGTQFKFAMAAREQMSKLLDIFNETGVIAQEVLDQITKNLGEAADEVQELVRLWVIYNQLQEELKKLEQARKGVLDTYRQEIQLIAQSNKTAEEKADAIRLAMRERDNELRIIKKQENAIEDQSDAAKEALNLQKAMIAAMQKQDDLQASMLNAIEKIAKALSKIGDVAFPALEDIVPGDLGDSLQELFEPILTLEERFEQGEKAFDGFFAALTGAPFDETLFAELKKFDEENGTDFAETYKNLFDLGSKLFAIWDKISGVWDTATGFFEKLMGLDIEKFGQDVGTAATSLDGLLGFIVDNLDSILLFLGIFKGLTVLFGILEGLGKIKLFSTLLSLAKNSALGGILQSIATGIGLLVLSFKTGGFAAAGAELLGLLGITLGTVLAGLLALLIVLIIKLGPGIVEAWSGIFENFKIIFGKAKESVFGIFENIATIIKHVWEGIKINAGIIWDKIVLVVSEKVLEIIAKIQEIVAGVGDALKGLKNKIVGKFEDAWNAAKTKMKEILESIGKSITGALEGFVGRFKTTPLFILFTEGVEGLKEIWDEVWTHLQETLGPVLENLGVLISELWTRIKENVETKWAEIKEAVLSAIVDLLIGILMKMDEIKTGVEERWNLLKEVATVVWEGIKTAVVEKITALKTAITEKVDAIKDALSERWELIKTIASRIWENIKTAIVEKVSGFIVPIMEKVDTIKDRISKAWTSIKIAAVIMWAKVREAISKAWDKIKTAVSEKVEAVRKTVANFRDKFIAVGKSIINGIKDGVISAAKGLIDAVARAVQGALDWVKRKLQIGSPSKVFMEIGISTMMGMALGIEQTGMELNNAVTSTIDSNVLGALPVGFQGPALAPAGGVGGAGGINLHFGRDSVRSDRDIDEIVERVKMVLASDAEDSMSLGTPFGGDI